MKSLMDLVRAYALYRGLRTDSSNRLGWAVRSFGEFLGREARLGDLKDEPVSHWIAAIERTLSQKSVYGYRVDLLTLWRDCASQGLCLPPQRVRRVHKPHPMPESWTAAEFSTLLAFVRTIDGFFPGGIHRREYCETLLRVCYDTGLRRSDVWTLRRQQILDDGTVALRQHKTNWPHFPLMRAETLLRFRALPGDPPLACPYKSPSTFYRWWKTVTRAAGVRHGAMQRVRKTGATHLAIDHRDAVSRYLGHRTADMVRYYIDESIAQPKQVLPPPLPE